MSSRTTAHTATTDPMIGASLGVTELEDVWFTGIVNNDDNRVELKIAIEWRVRKNYKCEC